MESMNEGEADSNASKKSRRHSSNTKNPGQNIAPNISSVEGVCKDLISAYSSGSTNELLAAEELQARNLQVIETMGSTEIARGQRVASRRRSMML
jgi:hypothetical protein